MWRNGLCLLALMTTVSVSTLAETNKLVGGGSSFNFASLWSDPANFIQVPGPDKTIVATQALLDTDAYTKDLEIAAWLDANEDKQVYGAAILNVSGNLTVDPGVNLGTPPGVAQYGAFWAITTVTGNFNNQGTATLGDFMSVRGNATNSGSFQTNLFDKPFTTSIQGNFTNTGTVSVAGFGDGLTQGTMALNVGKTFVNESGASLAVNQPDPGLRGALNTGALINHGSVVLNGGTHSTAGVLESDGQFTIQTNDLSDPTSLHVQTLKINGGQFANNDSALLVGTGTVPDGFHGYKQFADGVLGIGAAEPFLSDGPVELAGTLDIMLPDGEKPIGSRYTIIISAEPGMVTGTFGVVNGAIFDGGLEKYAVDYQEYTVDLVVEANTTPEPGTVSLLLIGVAFAGLRLRKRSPQRSPVIRVQYGE
jgi:hypothetical protein